MRLSALILVALAACAGEEEVIIDDYVEDLPNSVDTAPVGGVDEVWQGTVGGADVADCVKMQPTDSLLVGVSVEVLDGPPVRVTLAIGTDLYPAREVSEGPDLYYGGRVTLSGSVACIEATSDETSTYEWFFTDCQNNDACVELPTERDPTNDADIDYPNTLENAQEVEVGPSYTGTLQDPHDLADCVTVPTTPGSFYELAVLSGSELNSNFELRVQDGETALEPIDVLPGVQALTEVVEASTEALGLCVVSEGAVRPYTFTWTGIQPE